MVGNELKKTVLLVDDNVSIRLLLRTALLHGGFIVIEAANGEDARDYLAACKVDTILSDLDMPLLNGLELCRITKASNVTRHIPFILLTATDDPVSKERARLAGADEYLVKLNSSLHEIVGTVKRLSSFQLSPDPAPIRPDWR